ncbi:hypothetical protein J5N97_016799 [Dioscorea zingiberensis]|uniref:Uncharacterized protein n=1 Tax=Dioscorea zingiberensis TaxID=325984 RepID=A0A9D5CKW1_9LILI|nr:hypothetical protein J5N97_016799 [Dioscorea zingiberensis]
MFCYVGKATKIFFFIVAVLAVTGLVLGFGVLRRGAAHKPQGCDDPQCRPTAVPFIPPPSNPSSPSSSSSSSSFPSVASPPPLLSPPNPISFQVSPPLPYP